MVDPLTASGCKRGGDTANSVPTSGGHSLRESTGVRGNLYVNNNVIRTSTTATNQNSANTYNNRPPDDQRHYSDSNNNDRNNNNDNRSRHYRDRTQGTHRNQARAGRFSVDQAARAFQAQSQQFDTGSKKFVERLQVTQEELASHVHRESKGRTSKKKNSERFRLAAGKNARRESAARLSVVTEVKALSSRKSNMATLPARNRTMRSAS